MSEHPQEAPKEPPIPKAVPDIPDDYRAEVNAIYNTWHDGKLAFHEAVKQYDEMRLAAGDDVMKLGALDNILGIMHGYRSNYEESIKYFEAARVHFEKVGALRRVVSCDLNVGESYRLQGNHIRARSYFHRAYEAAKSMDSLRMQTTALGNEGQIWLTLGSYEKARHALEKAIELANQEWQGLDAYGNVELNKNDSKCEMYHALALISLAENKLDEAWQHAKKSLDYAQKVERPLRLGFANRALGDVITVLGKSPEEGFSAEPETYYQAAIKAFKQVKAEGEVGRTQVAIGKSLAQRGKKPAAARAFQQAMVIFTKLGMSNDAAQAAEEQLKVSY